MTSACASCGRSDRPCDRDGLCPDCAFVAKLRTLTIIPVPAALREVRRRYGHAGETDRDSERRKDRLGTYRDD